MDTGLHSFVRPIEVRLTNLFFSKSNKQFFTQFQQIILPAMLGPPAKLTLPKRISGEVTFFTNVA